MTRTQISLTQEQYRFLVDFARQSGKSISEIVRQAVDRLRGEEETPDRKALRLVGRFEADRHDISVRHDEVLFGESISKSGKKRS